MDHIAHTFLGGMVDDLFHIERIAEYVKRVLNLFVLVIFFKLLLELKKK